MATDEERESRTWALGDNTHIKLGFIIGLLGLMAAGFGMWIWWAATINSKIDTIITQQSSVIQTANNHSAAISDLQAWRKLIDTVGTPAMMNKTAEIEKQIGELSRQFELHRAVTGKP